MLLAFKISDIVTVPFGWLLAVLYDLTSNYGVALILFAVLVKLILLPLTAKGKKSMMKMSRLTPRMQEIQTKYADDQLKQSQAIQELYKSEHISMFGGCLWSFIPLLILIPLYNVIRQPIVYMLGETAENAALIIKTMQEAAPNLFSGNAFYAEMTAARHLPDFANEIMAVLPNISEATLQGVNFSFLGIDLGQVPHFNIFAWEAYDWAHIGLFLVPILASVSQILSMFISNKMNNSVVTDANGVRDEETAKKSQANQTNKIMMYMMPIMSLWIGITVSGTLTKEELASAPSATLTITAYAAQVDGMADAKDAWTKAGF